MPQSLPDNSFAGLIDPNESTRTSRYCRPPLRPMQLTQRDEQIITRCWEDKLLSTSDVHTLFFGARARCVGRLRTLYSNYYLDRYFFPVVAPYRGGCEALYTIGTKGSPIASLRLEQSQNYVAMKRRDFNERMRSPSFLLTFRHLRTVISTRICFERAFGHVTDWQLTRWIPERLLEDQFTVCSDGHLRTTKIRADGFFQYQHLATGTMYSAFVESDLGTMSHGQITAKVGRYLDYFQTALPEQKFGTRWFRVLMITSSVGRADELWQTLSGLTHSIFWLTSFDEIDKASWLTAPVWRRVGHDGKHALLTSPAARSTSERD